LLETKEKNGQAGGLKLTITIEETEYKGKKSPFVKINGHAISYPELLEILDKLFKAEDERYPPPAQGRRYLLNAIIDLHNGMPIPKIKEKYKLK